MKNLLNKLKNNDLADKTTLLVAMVAMTILFSVMNKNFFTFSNLINILIACSVVGFVAIGETNLIIAGQTDLSPGSVAAFAGVLCAMQVAAGMPTWLAIAITLAAGCAIGAINSALVSFLDLQPFIATLATMQVVRGAAYIMCGGTAVGVTEDSYRVLGNYRLFGQIPMPVVIMIVAFIFFGILLSKTKFGRSMYMLGGNAYASKLAGLNSRAILFVLYIVASGLAALAGILLTARMSSGQPTSNVGLEFDAITSAVLGGTAFSGGIGTISGTFLGMLVLQGFKTGLNMIGLVTFWQQVAQGALLILALAFDFYRKKNRDKKLLEESMRSRGITMHK